VRVLDAFLTRFSYGPELQPGLGASDAGKALRDSDNDWPHGALHNISFSYVTFCATGTLSQKADAIDAAPRTGKECHRTRAARQRGLKFQHGRCRHGVHEVRPSHLKPPGLSMLCAFLQAVGRARASDISGDAIVPRARGATERAPAEDKSKRRVFPSTFRSSRRHPSNNRVATGMGLSNHELQHVVALL
jgi:hypothetical protein